MVELWEIVDVAVDVRRRGIDPRDYIAESEVGRGGCDFAIKDSPWPNFVGRL